MTKTFAKIAARHSVKSNESGMLPLGAMTDRSFVCFFKFGSRAAQALAPHVGICLRLVFDAWNFHNKYTHSVRAGHLLCLPNYGLLCKSQLTIPPAMSI
jgi:hypothetical protein